jgi:hypothetical protein
MKRAMQLMGSKGGKKAAAKMTKKERSERARLAGEASGVARRAKAKNSTADNKKESVTE